MLLCCDIVVQAIPKALYWPRAETVCCRPRLSRSVAHSIAQDYHGITSFVHDPSCVTTGVPMMLPKLPQMLALNVPMWSCLFLKFIANGPVSATKRLWLKLNFWEKSVFALKFVDNQNDYGLCKREVLRGQTSSHIPDSSREKKDFHPSLVLVVWANYNSQCDIEFFVTQRPIIQSEPIALWMHMYGTNIWSFFGCSVWKRGVSNCWPYIRGYYKEWWI